MVGLPGRQVTGAGLADRRAVEPRVLVAVVDPQHDPAVRAGGVVPVVEARRAERVDPVEQVVPTGRLAVYPTEYVAALLALEQAEPRPVLRVEDVLA